MKRLRPLDIALLVVLSLVWGGSFFLYLQEVRAGRLARAPLFVQSPENSEAYPVLVGFWPGTGAEQSGLVIGDQLLRLGTADLRGVSSLGFTARVYEEATTDLRVSVTFLRAGQSGEALLSLDPVVFPWRTVPLIVGFFVTGVLTFVRMPGARPARAFFLGSLAYSLNWTLFFGGPRWQTYSWALVYFLSSLVIFPLILRATLLLPEEAAPTNKWALRWPWVFALLGPLSFSWYFGVPLPHEIGMRGFHVLNEAFLVTLLVLLTRNFRRAGPLGRRQLKWVVYGLYIGTVPVLAAIVVAMLDPRLWWLQEVAIVAMALTPACVCIAIVRFNLFDIDRLISSTAAYSVWLIVLGAGALTAVATLSASLSTLVGIEQIVGQAALSLFLAAVIVPGQRYLRPQIERLFFAQRYAVEQGIKQLWRELPAEDSRLATLTLVGERLFAVLRPEHCVIYDKVETRYLPVFICGSIAPPPFEAQSPLVGALQARAIAGDMDRWQRTMRVSLNRAERAVIDGLRLAAVAPLGLGETPRAFLCLGRKRSGDVYTSTDNKALHTISEKLSEALQRFDDSASLQQEAAVR